MGEHAFDLSNGWTVLHGDCVQVLKTLPDQFVQCCVTSPPYWGLRDYHVEGQIGLEETPEDYVINMVTVFREVWRVLRDDGTLWLNLGDSYASGGKGGGGSFSDQRKAWKEKSEVRGWRSAPSGLKNKDLVGVPWRVAFALQADGWYLRTDIVWHKSNPMPESVTDRPTRAHEYIFLFSKSPRYYYDAESIREPISCPKSSKASDMTRTFNRRRIVTPNVNRRDCIEPERELPNGRNKRTVWTVPTNSNGIAHFATYPPDLIKPCILAGARVNDIVLDPFNGSGTTGLVATRHNRRYLGIELNPEYVELSKRRIIGDAPLFNGIETLSV